MAKEIVQMYDKYHSTKKVYPKIIEECLPEEYQGLPETVEEIPIVAANPVVTEETPELTSLKIGDTDYKVGGGKQLYQHNIVLKATYTIGDIRVLFIIEDENNTQYTTISDLKTAYYNKYGEIERMATGYSIDTSSNLYRFINTILYNHTNNVFEIKNMSTTGVVSTLDIIESSFSASLSITDNPIPL